MKANYCPNCGSNKVDGGLTDNQLIIIGIITIATFFLAFIPGLVLYAGLRKANCINCGHKWKPNAKSETHGYQKFKNLDTETDNQQIN